MTREQILAMQAGREMDVLVAEKILGLTVVRQQEPDHFLHGLAKALHVPKHERAAIPMVQMWRTSDGKTLLRHSTDDAAALEVVPAMGKRGWDCATYYEGEARRWTVYFLNASLKPADARAESGSLAEAVCKAALLALLEEGEGA